MTSVAEAKKLVAESGRMLLQEGLAARTWGNVSCFIEKDTIVITPSGLAYEGMKPEDIVLLNMETDQWEGNFKPSSEKGVHIAAYRELKDAGFVIHTHQVYASAIGLAGMENLSLTDEERAGIGGIETTKYALPGTKKLAANVAEAFRGGAHAVLLPRHGAVIAGKDREEAFGRALMLEDICRRACKGQPSEAPDFDKELAEYLTSSVRKAFGHGAYTSTVSVLACAAEGETISAQLDDMAQMIGPRLFVVSVHEQAVIKALEKQEVVLIPGAGAICRASTDKDCQAMCLLTEKACICWLHTKALGIKKHLSWIDARSMRRIYLKKYSGMIGG